MRPLRLQLRTLHLRKPCLRLIPFLARHQLRNLHHLLHRVRLEQILVVEVVEKNVDALVHVFHLRLESLWRHGLDAGNLWSEQVNNRLCG